MTPTASAIIFKVLDGKFLVGKLPPSAEIPEQALKGEFSSVSRTAEELSIVAPEDAKIPDGEFERGWKCIKVQGPLEFALKGVLSSLLQPLADAGVSVFAVSTYDTDYILVKQHQLSQAVVALEQAGHRLTQS
jgi:hypothetical protein